MSAAEPIAEQIAEQIADHEPEHAAAHAEPTRDAGAVQLRLLGSDDRPDWVLDSKTRRVGRAGVAEAREVLRRARPPEPVRQRDRIAS